MTKLYSISLKLHVEDCESEIRIESGFDTFQFIIQTGEKVMTINLEYIDARELIDMLQQALIHQGKEDKV